MSIIYLPWLPESKQRMGVIYDFPTVSNESTILLTYFWFSAKLLLAYSRESIAWGLETSQKNKLFVYFRICFKLEWAEFSRWVTICDCSLNIFRISHILLKHFFSDIIRLFAKFARAYSKFSAQIDRKMKKKYSTIIAPTDIFSCFFH